MTKYVPRGNYALDYGTAWPGLEVISFGILTSSRGTQNLTNKIHRNEEDKNMEPGTIALILMFVVGYGGSHLFKEIIKVHK